MLLVVVSVESLAGPVVGVSGTLAMITDSGRLDSVSCSLFVTLTMKFTVLPTGDEGSSVTV